MEWAKNGLSQKWNDKQIKWSRIGISHKWNDRVWNGLKMIPFLFQLLWDTILECVKKSLCILIWSSELGVPYQQRHCIRELLPLWTGLFFVTKNGSGTRFFFFSPLAIFHNHFRNDFGKKWTPKRKSHLFIPY